MDKAETIVATKRLQRAEEEWRKWGLDRLPEKEREIVLLLIAHLDAKPVTDDDD